MTAPLNTAKLGFLLPVVLNPASVAIVGVGLGLLWMLRDDEEEASVDVKRVPAVENLPNEIVPKARTVVPDGTLAAAQKEIIRSAMSELGKRSAAARAKKKSDRDEQAARLGCGL